MVGGPWDDVRVQELFISNRERREKRRYNARERKAEEDWKWAKNEGKRPVGGRRHLAVSKPAPSPATTLVASQVVDDEWKDPGFFDEDTQKAILMSMGIIPEDFEIDHKASANHQQLDNRVVGLPISTPPTWVPSDFEVYVDEMGDVKKALQKPMREVQMPGLTNGNNHRFGVNGFLRTDLDKVIAGSKQGATGWPSNGARMGNGRSRLPMLATATLVSTGGEEDDFDEEGFLKSQRQQATTASTIAMTMPFYGASTSCAVQPLSDEEWARLEQFEAIPWSLVETVRPQSVLSMDVDTEVVQSWVPPPPPEPAPAAAPAKIKEASRTKKIIKKILKRVKTTFQLKNRNRTTGVL
ncbi:hypothetical protein M407DRAFT_214129 [Tulasnella calospora MUT 4182]|uniref:Uncharacterized protein n=1 Tax=Tulasnella calospora MUT 4182 TaxID=1051891 RepID=A0A0C3Q484_9AGAM|nr:hypothetical protein M407DRAFT_214129 [Tulasnella calospora MUT 4182]